MSTPVTPYTFQIKDQSGLEASSYSLRVMGFSVASELLLQPASGSTLAWAPPPAGVAVTAAISAGSAIATLPSLPFGTDLMVGDVITGTGIPAGTTITGISVAATLNNALTTAVSGSVSVLSATLVGGTVASGASTITGLVPPPAVSALRVGQVVVAAGIPVGAQVTQIGPGFQVQLSQAATAQESYSGTSSLQFWLSLQGSGQANATAITLSGMASAALVSLGASVTGTGVPVNTVVSGLGSIQLTLSAPATATNAAAALTATQTQSGTAASGATTVTGLTSTAALGVGSPVQGIGIPGGTTIAAITSSTALQLSTAATAAVDSLTFVRPTGVVPSFDISTYSSFVFDPTQQTGGLNGARIYFFVVPTAWPATASQPGFQGYPTNPPGFPYAWTGTGFGIMQANTPPNTPNTTSSYPPYAIVEPTVDPQSAGGNLHIDVQTVDGFTFGLSLVLSDASGNALGQVGQPVPANGVTRGAIIAAFQAAFPSGNPYAPLLYGGPNDIDSQYPGLLNPGAYLAAGANAGSALATMWTATLTTLYAGANSLLNMIGDDGDYYQGKPITVGTASVLQFTGYKDATMKTTNGNVFNLYSPLTPDAANTGLGAGFQVFANAGVFADVSGDVLQQTNGGTAPTPSSVALGLQRDIVSALNRGIALLAPQGTTGRTAGDTSAYWGTETNWYPSAMSDSTAPQNQFSLFMHTQMVNSVLIFTAPSNPAVTPQGATMGQAYGFAYDESPVHAALGQPNVPSKFDPAPAGTAQVEIVFGPWASAT